jgi:hypothetical protein
MYDIIIYYTLPKVGLREEGKKKRMLEKEQY